MKVCIVGAGSLGGVIGFRLAQGGHDVSLVARGEHLDAIQRRGLTLVNEETGSRETISIPAAEDPAAFGKQDVVFMTLKAHSIAEMLPRLQPMLSLDTPVVPAVNGIPWWYFYRHGETHEGRALRMLDPQREMFEALDCARILGCVVAMSAEIKAPGEVLLAAGKRISIGEIDRSLPDPITQRVVELVHAMAEVGFDAVAVRDIRTEVWVKLLSNVSFNPLTALTKAPTRQLGDNEGLLEIVQAVSRECIGVAQQVGIEVPISADTLIDLLRRPWPTRSVRSSMLQDFEKGRRPEIDAILGAVIELAHLVNQPVPTIRMIESILRERARNEGLL